MDDQLAIPRKKRLDLSQPQALSAAKWQEVAAFAAAYDAKELPPAAELTAEQLKEIAENRQTAPPAMPPPSLPNASRR